MTKRYRLFAAENKPLTLDKEVYFTRDEVKAIERACEILQIPIVKKVPVKPKS